MIKESVDSSVQKAQQAVTTGEHQGTSYYQSPVGAFGPAERALRTGHGLLPAQRPDQRRPPLQGSDAARPHPAGAYINLGAVYNKLDQLDEAIAALRTASSSTRIGPRVTTTSAWSTAARARSTWPSRPTARPPASTRHARRPLQPGQPVPGERQLQPGPDRTISTPWSSGPTGRRPSTGWSKCGKCSRKTPPRNQQPVEEEAETDEEPTQHILDPERTVDPYVHGALLFDLHHATKDSEQLSRDFVQLLQTEIEPAIKLLSNCLLQTNQSSMELDQTVQKVEAALAHMSATEKKLQKSIEKMRESGDQLLQK